MNHSKDTKFVYDTETFVKESLDSFTSGTLVLAATHDFGQIQIEYNRNNMLISGTVYTFLDNGTEQCYNLPPKDLAYDQTNFLILSSAVYAYLSDAYKIANMFKQTTFQSTDYAN
jgi:hypothetical protein